MSHCTLPLTSRWSKAAPAVHRKCFGRRADRVDANIIPAEIDDIIDRTPLIGGIPQRFASQCRRKHARVKSGGGNLRYGSLEKLG